MSLDPTSWGWPFPATWSAFFVIVVLRANATYWAGRLVRRGLAGGETSGVDGGGRGVAARLGRPGYRRAAGWVDRWGAPAVTLSFLTVGVQTMVNLAAGASRMSQWRYLPAVVLGSVLWASVYSTLGFVGLTAVSRLWQRSPGAAVGVLAVLGLLLALFWARQHRRPADGPPGRSGPRSAEPGDQ